VCVSINVPFGETQLLNITDILFIVVSDYLHPVQDVLRNPVAQNFLGQLMKKCQTLMQHERQLLHLLEPAIGSNLGN
jgi:hypothetical protein